MSHIQYTYPQSVAYNDPWQVRETDDYTVEQLELIGLSDRVIDKLLKAEAVAWVLHSSDGYPDNALQETTWVIADLLHEALETARRQAERIRRLNN